MTAASLTPTPAARTARSGRALAPRRAHVRAAVADYVSRHRVLRAATPPTLADLLDVCEREGIHVRRADFPAAIHGRAMRIFGVCVIQLANALSDDDARYVLAHELGHVALHVFDAYVCARIAREYSAGGWPRTLRPGRVAARCEAEADLFAAWLGCPDTLTLDAECATSAGRGR